MKPDMQYTLQTLSSCCAYTMDSNTPPRIGTPADTPPNPNPNINPNTNPNRGEGWGGGSVRRN